MLHLLLLDRRVLSSRESLSLDKRDSRRERRKRGKIIERLMMMSPADAEMKRKHESLSVIVGTNDGKKKSASSHKRTRHRNSS